jgi:hypothetical protein
MEHVDIARNHQSDAHGRLLPFIGRGRLSRRHLIFDMPVEHRA